MPIATGLATGLTQVQLDPGLSAGLVTVSGLLSAFFFSGMLQIAQRAMDWADLNPEPGPDTSEHAIFLEELAANAAYASLVSIVTAALFVGASVGASVKSHWMLVVFSAVGVAAAVHLVLVLFMVMKRTLAITQSRLTRARTGAGNLRVRAR